MAWTKKEQCLAPIPRASYHDPRKPSLCQNVAVPGKGRCRHHIGMGPKKPRDIAAEQPRVKMTVPTLMEINDAIAEVARDQRGFPVGKLAPNILVYEVIQKLKGR